MTDHPNPQLFIAAKNDQSIMDQGFDEFETQVLHIARRFFQTFSSPKTQSWQLAFYDAERFFPAPFGATIATAILAVVDELRVARKSSFVFINGDCRNCSHRVTQEERYLIASLHHVRRRSRSQAHTNAMMLCEGHDPSDFLHAVGRLALITGDTDEAFLKDLMR